MNTIKYLLIIIFFLVGCSTTNSSSNVDVYKQGDILPVYTLYDQHGKKHILTEKTKYVALAFDMDVAKSINEDLTNKESGFLEKNKIFYVADISEMPQFVTLLFAGPKMKKYEFPIIWATEKDFKLDFPKEIKKLTIIELEKGFKIKSIFYSNNFEFVE